MSSNKKDTHVYESDKGKYVKENKSPSGRNASGRNGKTLSYTDKTNKK